MRIRPPPLCVAALLAACIASEAIEVGQPLALTPYAGQADVALDLWQQQHGPAADCADALSVTWLVESDDAVLWRCNAPTDNGCLIAGVSRWDGVYRHSIVMREGLGELAAPTVNHELLHLLLSCSGVRADGDPEHNHAAWRETLPMLDARL